MGRKKERQESGHNGDKELLKRLHCNTRATPRRQGCALFAPSTGPPAPQAPQQRNGRESAPRMGARQLPNGTGHSAPHAQPVGLHECDCDNSSHYFACRHSPPSPVRTLAHMPSSLSHRFPRAVPFLLVPSKTISINPPRRLKNNFLKNNFPHAGTAGLPQESCQGTGLWVRLFHSRGLAGRAGASDGSGVVMTL